MQSRLASALLGLLVSLAITGALYWWTDSLLVFLFVPFVPFLFSRGSDGGTEAEPEAYECPVCGFQTRDPEFDYCPRDGTRLERPDEGAW